MVSDSSVDPLQLSSTPLQTSVTGEIEHAPHMPPPHVWVPAAHAPGCGHARVAAPEHAQSAAGFATPSQFSSTIAASHSSVAAGLTAPLPSLQSTLPPLGARFVVPSGQPPTP